VTFEKILRFAYLRDVAGVNRENVLELLIVSDYLGVLGLVKFCIEFAIKMMSPENCIVLWLLSR
jgi:hypothetical protein